jgi:iron(III) transport system substrate-binding protein
VPHLPSIRLIDYDYAKYGASAERRRLIDRWEREVNSLPH